MQIISTVPQIKTNIFIQHALKLWLWVTLITLLFFFPISYAIYKYLLAGLILLVVFIIAISKKHLLTINVRLAIGLFTSILIGSFAIFYNILLFPNVRSISPATFWILGPIVYTLFIFLSSNKRDLNLIFDNVVYLSTLAICTNSLLYLTSHIFGFDYPLEFLDLDYKVNTVSIISSYSTSNIPILGFTLPYIIANIFIVERKDLFRLFVFLVGIVAIIFSLRITIWLCIMLAITTVLFYRFKKLLFSPKTYIAILLAGMFIATYSYTNKENTEYIYNAKMKSEIEGVDPRYKQAEIWIEYFLQKPYFGHGLSAIEVRKEGEKRVIIGYLTNEYGYELIYLTLLVKIGAIPFIILIWLLFRLSVLLVRTGTRGETLIEKNAWSHLFGMYGLIITSSTNGYLLTFGCIWACFFPVAYLNNVWYLKKKHFLCNLH